MATLARFQRTVTDDLGNILPGASVEVRREDNLSRLANIYSDRAGLVAKANPFLVGDDALAAFHTLGGLGGLRIKATAVVEGEAVEIEWKNEPCGTGAEIDVTAGITGGTLLTYSSLTADADPGEGFVRFNHATHASVTFLFVSDDNVYGDPIAALVDSWDDIGAEELRGRLRIQVDGDAAVWREFVVTGDVVDASGYKKVPVALVDGGGDLLGDEQLAITFAPAGPGHASQIDYEGGPGFTATTVEGALDEAGEKLQHISVTQPVDLDSIEARVNSLDAAVVLRGTWDASAGTFPNSGGGGTAGAVITGDSFIVSTGGTVGGVPFNSGDRLIAIADAPSTTVYASNWFKADYTDLLTGATLGDALASCSAKTTPVDADVVGLGDSADSGILKKLTWSNIKATLKTYFDPLYADAATVRTLLGFPNATTDNRLVRHDGTTGGQQSSAVTVNDSGDMSGVRNLSASGAVVLSGDISPTSLSAQADDYAPTGFSTAARVRLDSTTNVVITGIAGGTDGRRVTLHNIGANTITLMNESASSTAANRFKLDANVAISAGKSIDIEYDATDSRWRVIGGVGGGGSSGPITLSYDSGEQTITSSGSLTLAHGLGIVPKIIVPILVCKTADLGYSVGDRVVMHTNMQDYANVAGMAVVVDNTNIFVRFSSNPVVFGLFNKSTGSQSGITLARWKIVFQAYA